MEKVYLVNKISKGEEGGTFWDRASVLSNFTQPWEQVTPQGTMFRALHDGEHLYLRYDIMDDDVHIFWKEDTQDEVIYSDRVEIFLRKDIGLREYYCLEIDPSGRVLDYSASYYRKFKMDWNWPQKYLKVNTHITNIGYSIFVALDLGFLKQLMLLKDNVVEAGIFRADCRRLVTDINQEPFIKWITWIDPGTKHPDFHVPSAFGTMLLKEYPK